MDQVTTQLAAQLHDIWLFLRAIFMVGVYCGLIPGIGALLLVRGLLQAYLYRNVADHRKFQ